MRDRKAKPDALDRLLAGDGKDGSPGWEEKVRDVAPPPAYTVDKYVRVPVRMGRTLNRYSAQCAAMDGLSRTAWLRHLMADRIQEVMGIPPEVSLAEAEADSKQYIRERLTGG